MRITTLPSLFAVIVVTMLTAEAMTASARQTSPATSVDRRTVAVILVNTTSCPDCYWDIDEVRQELFTGQDSANAFYQESSGGKLVLEGRDREDGDIYGPVAISMKLRRCYPALRISKARAAAERMGYDLSGYDHYIYIWRSVNGCHSGQAQYRGDTLYLNTSHEYGIGSVAIHELGHNFGLKHSNSLECFDGQGTRVSISDNCVINEAADPFDPMGYSTLYEDRHNHNWNKLRLGFLPWASAKVVDQSGNYTLQPSERPLLYSTQALLIPRTMDKIGRALEYYALDFRQPYGIFDNFPADDPAVNGVAARIVPNTDTTSGKACYYLRGTMLVNAHPEQVNEYHIPTNAPIGPGERLVDPIAGLTISVDSISPQSASVRVDFQSTRRADPKRRAMRIAAGTQSHGERSLESEPMRLKQKCAAEGYEMPR